MNKEIEIPEGYEARIDGNKVILEQKESEDEWIRKHIIKILDGLAPCHWDGNEKARCIVYLERQKESTKWRKYSWHPGMRFDYGALVKYDGLYGFEIVPAGNRPSKEVNGMYVFLKDI